MANFMRGFAKGLESGQKLGEAWNTATMKRELKEANAADQSTTTAYTPEQIAALNESYGPKDGETWNAEMGGYQDANGGLRTVTAPTVDDKGTYTDSSTGATTASKSQYQLGNKTQDAAFTADDIAAHKLGLKADIYSNYGHEEMADNMRANALTRKMSGLQIKGIEDENKANDTMAGYFKQANEHDANTEKVTQPLIDAVSKGQMSLQEAVPKMLVPYNADLPNGEHLSYDQTKGTLIKTVNGKGSTVLGPDGKPMIIDAEHLSSFLETSKARTSSWLKQKHMELYPKQYMEHMRMQDARDQFNQTYSAGRADAATSDDHFNKNYTQSGDQFTRTLDQSSKQHKETLANAWNIANANNDAAYRRAQVTKGAYETLTPFGQAADGSMIFSSNHNGTISIDSNGKHHQVTDYNGVKRFASEAKDDTKAQEAYAKFVTENPDVKPEVLDRMKRTLGLAPPIDLGSDPSRPLYNPNAVNYGNAGGLGSVSDQNRPRGNVLPIGADGNIIMPSRDEETQGGLILEDGRPRKNLWNK